MANTSSINLLDLDFFSLKTNFKNYLRNQARFKDYDFDGSNINVLLDILSYNTFKNSFYTNMLFSEAFLDTAQLRGSLISHAKELNYNPGSARSSKARVRVDFEATSETQPYIISKGQNLSAIVKNTNFTFSLPETMSVASANNSFSFETDIYEGVYVKDTHIFRQVGDEIPRFKITNKNVDTESLTVTIFSDNSANGETYSLTRTLLDLDFKSKVYFLQCNENEFYEVYFGDNILGKKPSDYSTIVLDYRISSGPVADNALQFVLNFNPTGHNNELLAPPDVTTIDVSKGGQSPETTESIRFYAPRAFQTQERTVTAQDYETVLKIQFPEINAVYAYGGEEADPPMFGRVFVAVDVSNVSGIPDSKKREYANFLKRRAPFSIEAIFIEPEYAYLAIEADIRYNINVTKIPSETMRTIINNTILNFRDKHLNDFNVTFRNSKLANDIDDADVSIISSVLNVLLYKKIDLQPGVKQNIVLKYNCALVDNIPVKGDVYPATDVHAFVSSPFRFSGQTCIFEDDGDGIVRLVSTDGVKNFKIYNVGTIDYDTGIVNLSGVTIDTFLGSAVKFYARPRDLDISTQNNTILSIEDDAIVVNIEQLRE
jgi:hypothetical protein